MAQFRWGFKSECERISLEIRGELGLEPVDRLDPGLLADHLAIPVVSIADLPGCEDAVLHLTSADSGAFSAATVFRGTRRIVIFNPAHPPGRNSNSMAHELSHCLLEHVPGPVTDDVGQRRWSEQDEAEADWMAGALLVPRDGIIANMYRFGSVPAAAAHYGVSQQLMTWRLNHTGAARQMQRAARASRAGYR